MLCTRFIKLPGSQASVVPQTNAVSRQPSAVSRQLILFKSTQVAPSVAHKHLK
ncbi:MAG: hypothetical protein F6J90_36185 [Moorea sp. SIOASIH]|nr:hypothetical protein [Moorena sp. SIOASIH]